MKVENFEQLEVWQKAHAMALDVYKLTSDLPEEEEFGLILRMRKAACDVPANIANGFERRQMNAKLSLYREARAAVEELRYYFILCRDLATPSTSRSSARAASNSPAWSADWSARSLASRATDRRSAAAGGGGDRDRGRGRDRGDRGDRGPRNEGGEQSEITGEQTGADTTSASDRGEPTA